MKLTFTFANVLIIFMKSIVIPSSDLMLSKLSDTSHTSVELFLGFFFTKLSLLNERSPVATVTGMVRNIHSHIERIIFFILRRIMDGARTLFYADQGPNDRKIRIKGLQVTL